MNISLRQQKCLYFYFPLNVDISQNAILHFGEFYSSIWLNDHERGSAGNKQIIRLLSLERSLNFACNCALLIEKHEVFTQKHTTDIALPKVCRKVQANKFTLSGFLWIETLQPTQITLAMQTLICLSVYTPPMTCGLKRDLWGCCVGCRGAGIQTVGTMHLWSRIKRAQRE